jgi:hypothetical protein
VTVSNETLHLGLKATLDETDLDVLGDKYEGKVRDNYTAGGKRYIVVTDRISAFDRVLGTLPFKGQVSTAWPRGGSTRPRTWSPTTCWTCRTPTSWWASSASRCRSR